MSMSPRILILSLLLPLVAQAGDFATPPEAEAMVARVVAAIKADPQATYAAINAKAAPWVDRDLYPVVYDLQGVVLAHGQNAKQVGQAMLGMKDPDGKLYIKERIEWAQTRETFWQDYKFTDPVSKAVLPKRMYCQRLDATVVCAGVYSR